MIAGDVRPKTLDFTTFQLEPGAVQLVTNSKYHDTKKPALNPSPHRFQFMKNLRSIGAFLIAGSLVCVVIAVDFYFEAISKGQALLGNIDGIEFESVGIPLESKVAGLLAVVFAVAGIRCWVQFTRQRKTSPSSDGMLEE